VTPIAVPLEGGTLITIYGLNFLPSIQYKITEFGTKIPIDAYISSSEIQLIAPPSSTIGNKSIYLTNNNVDFYQRYDLPILYYNGLIIHSITPNQILIGSQTIITIKGLDFLSDSRLLNSLKINNTLIPTKFIDVETLTAELPSFSSLTAETKFDVLITINHQDYYTGLTVTYILPPALVNFTPAFSNSQEQYFSINVTGNNFLYSNGLQ